MSSSLEIQEDKFDEIDSDVDDPLSDYNGDDYCIEGSFFSMRRLYHRIFFFFWRKFERPYRFKSTCSTYSVEGNLC